ncbi:MAG: DegT/DnrJ/EryC1/StrS family aminotransferase, partial [Candidatus Bipolaricaulia bacterium]
MTDDRGDRKVPRTSDPGSLTTDHGPRTPDAVPLLDLVRQYGAIRSEIDAAIGDVLKSGEFILGPHVKRFEDAAAAYCHVKHAIGLASGTDALLLSLRALGIGPGDAVLVPSFTFFATAGTVHNVGATPIFCDIDPKTYNIDPASARAVLDAHHDRSNPTNSTNPTNSAVRALIPVHLYGQMADMDEIMQLADEFHLAVIEDAAQAIGATYTSPGLRDPEPRTPHSVRLRRALRPFAARTPSVCGTDPELRTSDYAPRTAHRALNEPNER